MRREAQRARHALPELPTTTIGSFPQTPEIRAARTQPDYERFLERTIAEVIAHQEHVGLDVLVHGEPERNDMVEYFGERLRGFAFSEHGWVQSYGSRCVKPPILYGDVSRPEPMTVRWWQYAQSLTDKPVKGMLTGPVTILQWSFVRDDQPRVETCTQIALAIQDEVVDLEARGLLRDPGRRGRAARGPAAAPRGPGRLPALGGRLLPADRRARPRRRPRSTRTCATRSSTRSWTTSCAWMPTCSRSRPRRSGMEVLDAFACDYPNEIGPGVYDIHSPRVPSVDEIERLLELAEERVGRERLWVNPDCGLKTRGWNEVRPALANMVAAAHRRRAAVRVVMLAQAARVGHDRRGQPAARRRRRRPSTHVTAAYDVPFCPQLPRLEGDMVTEWLGADPRPLRLVARPRPRAPARLGRAARAAVARRRRRTAS